MPRNIHVLTLALCAALSSAPLFAATPINETRPLDARGTLEIDNLKGRIQVQAWDRNEVRVTGTLGDGVEKLIVEGDRGHLEVKVQYPERIGSWRGDRTGPTDLRLMVPLQANLEIESVSADISVDGVAPGDLEIDSVSGNITVAAAPARARIESVSGDVRLRLPKGTSARLEGETFSGDLRAPDAKIHREEFGPGATIEARYGSGSGVIHLESFSGDAILVFE